MILFLDVETYSEVDLTKNSVYGYAESSSFRILLLAYAFDNEPVEVIDLTNTRSRPPNRLLRALKDKTVLKVAHNAMFERVCLSKWLGVSLTAAGWRCTRVYASYLGLPGTLSELGKALHISHQKLEQGEELISLFCKPVKGKRVLGSDHPAEWADFIRYNQRDVEALREIYNRLSRYPIPIREWHIYTVDQTINDRGVQVDTDFALKAVSMGQKVNQELLEKAYHIGIENPRSTPGMTDWLKKQGVQPLDMRRKTVESLAKQSTGIVREGLDVRLELAKSSLSKYDAILRCVSQDGRLHGLFYHFGGHTGRWSCKYVQPQNLPQNHIADLDTARNLVTAGDIEKIRNDYGPPTGVLSQLIRTVFVPLPDKIFLVADYSQIESRTLSWIAGEKWRLDAFREGRDIYCESASKMFGMLVEKNGANAELRVLGKTAELGLGYQGGKQALINMGALDKGIPEQKLQELVDKWRSANPRIVKLWKFVENLCQQCIMNRTAYRSRLFTFGFIDGALYITLPSGRSLWYQEVALEQTDMGTQIGFDDYRNGRKKRTTTYGGRLTENIVQAVSRDILAHALSNLEAAGLSVVLHIHDEAVVEAPAGTDLQKVIDAMESVPSWAAGLPVKAEGYSCSYYQKK